MRHVLITSVLALCSCNVFSYGQPAGMSNDDVDMAALQIAKPLPECHDSYIGGTVAECDAVLTEIARRRAELPSVRPEWMRDAVSHWYDYFESEARKHRADCVSQRSKREFDEYRAERDAQNKRVREILENVGRGDRP